MIDPDGSYEESCDLVERLRAEIAELIECITEIAAQRDKAIALFYKVQRDLGDVDAVLATEGKP